MKKIFFLFLTFSLISFILAEEDIFLNIEEKKTLIKIYYKTAIKYFQQKNFEKSLEYCEEILKLDPNQSNAQKLKTLCYENLEEMKVKTYGYYKWFEEHILGIDDVIKINVEQHPEWSGNFTINPQGKIFIPQLGIIRAEGYTIKQFEEKFKEFLAQYIENPRVNIEVVNYASQVVYVLGEVNRPGKYSTEGKIWTLRDIIIKAGLPTRFAATSRVFIITPSRDINPKRKVVNLYRVLYKGELENNIEIKPGDIVYIPKNFLGIINDLISVLTSPLTSISTAKSAAVIP